MTTGGGHPSRSGVASWPTPALSSSGCMIGIEARASSALRRLVLKLQDEKKSTHMPAFPCAPQRQITARAQNPPQDVLPTGSPAHGWSGAGLCSWSASVGAPYVFGTGLPHSLPHNPPLPPPPSRPWALPPWAPGHPTLCV